MQIFKVLWKFTKCYRDYLEFWSRDWNKINNGAKSSAIWAFYTLLIVSRFRVEVNEDAVKIFAGGEAMFLYNKWAILWISNIFVGSKLEIKMSSNELHSSLTLIRIAVRDNRSRKSQWIECFFKDLREGNKRSRSL